MENVGILCGHLEYFTVICCLLWPFGNVVVIRYIFPRFGILCQENLATLFVTSDQILMFRVHRT
jgi:hypothetical protein